MRGVKRAYTQAQREMQLACSEASASNFHEWRKRLKALSYHLRLLSALAPGFRRQAAQMRRLEQQLGREHNLQVLRDYVARRSAHGHQRTVFRLTALAESRQQQLRRATLRAGAKVLAETPKAFVRRGFGRP
jgi:CHAD domain